MQYTVPLAAARIAFGRNALHAGLCAGNARFRLALSRRRAAGAAEKSIPDVNDSVPKREQPRCAALQSAGGGKQPLGAEK